jgi:protein associated with RNAse G/E
MTGTLNVIKLNPLGQETWRYQGQVLERQPDRLVLEAFFDRPDVDDFHGIQLRQGDRFIETYYTDRWYNIFEIHAVEDDRLRGWYCNITAPAQLDGDTLSYVDLALDLLVYPDLRQFVLDEDEFALLDITDIQKQQALQALAELQNIFK